MEKAALLTWICENCMILTCSDPYHLDTDPDPGCEKICSRSRANFDTDPDPDPGKSDPDPAKKD